MTKPTLIDVLTHQKIRESKFADLPDDAKIGNILLVMYPALFRCGKDGQNEIQIEDCHSYPRTGPLKKRQGS